MKKTAILLATYNGEKYLGAQIESILTQSDVCWDLYIRDDLSTDKTLEILAKYSVLDERIKVLPSEKRYGYAGSNFFSLLQDVDFSGYEYVAFCDQDDIWETEKLEFSINSLIEACADGFSSDMLAFWETGRTEVIVKSQKQTDIDYMFEVGSAGCTYVFTKKIAIAAKHILNENTDFRKEFFFHDWFIYALCRSKGCKWVISDKLLIKYRQHSGNETGANIGAKSILVRLKKLRSGWALDQLYMLADALNYKVTLANIIGNRNGSRLTFIKNFRRSRRRFRDCLALLVVYVFKIAK